jgi:hypothetical protein
MDTQPQLHRWSLKSQMGADVVDLVVHRWSTDSSAGSPRTTSYDCGPDGCSRPWFTRDRSHSGPSHSGSYSHFIGNGELGFASPGGGAAGVQLAHQATHGLATQQRFVFWSFEVGAAVDHLVALFGGVPLANFVHPDYPAVMPVPAAPSRGIVRFHAAGAKLDY